MSETLACSPIWHMDSLLSPPCWKCNIGGQLCGPRVKFRPNEWAQNSYSALVEPPALLSVPTMLGKPAMYHFNYLPSQVTTWTDPMGMESPLALKKPWSSPCPNKLSSPHHKNQDSFHHKHQKPKSNYCQPEKQGWEKIKWLVQTEFSVQQAVDMAELNGLFHSVLCSLGFYLPQATLTSEKERTSFSWVSVKILEVSNLPSSGHMSMPEPTTEVQGIEYSDWPAWVICSVPELRW